MADIFEGGEKEKCGEERDKNAFSQWRVSNSCDEGIRTGSNRKRENANMNMCVL